MPYLDAAGNPQTAATATDITAADCGTTLNTGWYPASSVITCNATITINGNVNLILADDASLSVTGDANDAGINVSDANSLTVYAQSTDPHMDSLTANGGSYGAGIGGGYYDNGGVVTATGGGLGAGIGGGGAITIHGGAVMATGGIDAAGIGGGVHDGSGGAGIGSGSSNDPAPAAAGTIVIDTSGPVSAGGAGANIGQGGYFGGDGAAALVLLVSSLTGGHGSVAPLGTLGVAVGSDQTYDMTPDPGYVIDTLTLDGADAMGLLAGNTLTLDHVTADHAIAVTFALSPMPLGNGSATAVPALGGAGLLLLALLLAGGAAAGMRRGR